MRITNTSLGTTILYFHISSPFKNYQSKRSEKTRGSGFNAFIKADSAFTIYMIFQLQQFLIHISWPNDLAKPSEYTELMLFWLLMLFQNKHHRSIPLNKFVQIKLTAVCCPPMFKNFANRQRLFVLYQPMIVIRQ